MVLELVNENYYFIRNRLDQYPPTTPSKKIATHTTSWLQKEHPEYRLDNSLNFKKFAGALRRAIDAVRKGDYKIVPDWKPDTGDIICGACSRETCYRWKIKNGLSSR